MTAPRALGRRRRRRQLRGLRATCCPAIRSRSARSRRCRSGIAACSAAARPRRRCAPARASACAAKHVGVSGTDDNGRRHPRRARRKRDVDIADLIIRDAAEPVRGDPRRRDDRRAHRAVGSRREAAAARARAADRGADDARGSSTWTTSIDDAAIRAARDRARRRRPGDERHRPHDRRAPSELAAGVTHADLRRARADPARRHQRSWKRALRKLRATLDNVLVRHAWASAGAMALEGDSLLPRARVQRPRARHHRRRRRVSRRLHLRARARPADRTRRCGPPTPPPRSAARGSARSTACRRSTKSASSSPPTSTGNPIGLRLARCAGRRGCSRAAAPAAPPDRCRPAAFACRGARRRRRRRRGRLRALRLGREAGRGRGAAGPRRRQLLPAHHAGAGRGGRRVSRLAGHARGGDATALTIEARRGAQRCRRRAGRDRRAGRAAACDGWERRRRRDVDGAGPLRTAEHGRQVHRPAALHVGTRSSRPRVAVSSATRSSSRTRTAGRRPIA